MPVLDMVGRTFGHLTVIKRSGSKNGQAMWRCQCDCGKTVAAIHGSSLRRGLTKSCGCGKALEMTGRRFGRLTVLSRNGSKNESALWRCRCDCGQEKTIRGDALRGGLTKSCGCLPRGSVPGQRQKEVVEYTAVHRRIRRLRGSASQYDCPCGKPAYHWSYDWLDPNQMVSSKEQSFGLVYSLDPARYRPMCVTCHSAYDSALTL